MAVEHCKADHPPKDRPCRECGRLQWELEGLRQRVASLQTEKQEMQQRIYFMLAEKRYAPE
jgi:hypothetical protein